MLQCTALHTTSSLVLVRVGIMATVEFVDASHTYPGTKSPAVDSLTLTIESGEFMGLLGASGWGKTTALLMLAGLESVDSGAVFIDGVDVTDHQPGERDIAMVFQNYALYPQMTVAGNLGFRLTLTGAPPPARGRGAEGGAAAARPPPPRGPRAKASLGGGAAAGGGGPGDEGRTKGLPDGRAA